VELVRETVPLAQIPPPELLAVLSDTVELVRVTVPKAKIPPALTTSRIVRHGGVGEGDRAIKSPNPPAKTKTSRIARHGGVGEGDRAKSKIPPPKSTPALLPDTVELVRVTVPLAKIPPPS
jgi:hypothetical protein